jgi:hypothetical protein
LLADWYAGKRTQRLAAGLIVLGATACLPFAIQYAYSGPGIFAMFRYHAEREVNLDSIYSTLMMIGALMGKKIYVAQGHGGFNLMGDLAPVMKALATTLLLGFLAGMGSWALWRRWRYTRQEAFRVVCYVMPAAVILSNVLSPQYLIWALPLMVLLGLEVLPQGNTAPLVLAVLLVVVAATTTWILPFHLYQRLTGPDSLVPLVEHPSTLSPRIGMVLGLRNFTYLGVVVWMGFMLLRSASGSEAAPTVRARAA